MHPRTNAKLQQEHYLRTRQYLAQRLGEGQDCDDLAQQVFEQLLHRPTPEDPATYIGALARNLLTRHLRKKQRELTALRKLLDTIEEDGLPDHSGRTYSPAECKDLLDDIAAHLAPKPMELLRMRFLEDLSPVEMATRLGCSEAAVHMRLQRVIKRLRRRYLVDE